MATRKPKADPSENITASSETVSASPPANPPPVDTQLIRQQNEQIAELKALIGNLGERLTAVQAVNARDAEFKSAVRSVETAAAAVSAASRPQAAAIDSPLPGHDCGCEPCKCLSLSCCTFEIWMSHVRADQMQTEPGDTNLVPTAVLEVWMFASIDPVNNIGVCIPDPSPLSYLPLHKQITDPTGPWVQVNRCVGTATVKKGVPLTVTVALTGVERETALERVIPANRDEWGSNTGTVTLDCCYSNYSPFDVPVSLTSWGQAGGAITARFIVVKRC